MTGKNRSWKRILIITIMTILTTPAISVGTGHIGQDWYCSDQDAHTGDYKKHVQLHLDRGADAIAEKLDAIYTDQSLTSEQRKDKTIEILNKYLLHVKAGMGD